jgi:ABC-2 type transport system permease protein
VSASSTVVFRDPAGHLWATVFATARAYVKRSNAYVIDIIRTPVFPLTYFVTWRVAYAVAGRGHVDGANASGFLLIGMFGLLTWSSTIWSSGYAIEHERHEGTVGALFLSPASRAAVVVGYGLGSLVWLLPSFLVTIAIGFATGARLHVADPLAVAGAAIALLVASLATGFAFAGLFVLSRRGNLLANFLQLPVYLLAGFLVPRSRLPGWLHPLSDAIPAGHAVDALRASSLGGATLQGIAGPLALAFGTAALYALIGWVSLRRVEHVAKRAGQLDLY